MKTRTSSLLPLALGAAALGISALSALAQGPGPGGPDGPPPGHRPPPPPSPVFEALDTNHDGVLSADEIKNASASLAALDKNKDGQLSEDEVRPVRPEGHHGPGPGPEGEGHGPRHHDEAKPNDAGGPPDAPGPREHRGPRLVPPLMAALDTNKDGVLSADEIANAAAALKTLDKNGDGQLTMDELRPVGPPPPPPHPED